MLNFGKAYVIVVEVVGIVLNIVALCMYERDSKVYRVAAALIPCFALTGKLLRGTATFYKS